MATKFPPMSPFAVSFAAAYRGFMKECGVSGRDIAALLGRNEGYVSERSNGKRALDTNDVDALAALAGDVWSGKTLMMELARRARETDIPSNVTRANFGGNVGGSGEDADAIDIPENVEEEWAGQYAADPAGDDPIDHGAP